MWKQGGAARHYGPSARTIRRWRTRSRQRHRGPGADLSSAPGPGGCRPRSIELIRHARQEARPTARAHAALVAARARIRLAMGTDPAWCSGIPWELPRLRRTRKRAPRQMKLFEKAEPGESIQVDVKYVSIAGRWALSVHRPGRLYALPRAAALPATAPPARAWPSSRSSGGPSCSPSSGCSATTGKSSPSGLRAGVEAAGIRHPAIFGPGRTAERQSRTEPSDRQRGVLGPAPPSQDFQRGCGRAAETGRPGTTTSASPWRSRAVHAAEKLAGASTRAAADRRPGAPHVYRARRRPETGGQSGRDPTQVLRGRCHSGESLAALRVAMNTFPGLPLV